MAFLLHLTSQLSKNVIVIGAGVWGSITGPVKSGAVRSLGLPQLRRFFRVGSCATQALDRGDSPRLSHSLHASVSYFEGNNNFF